MPTICVEHVREDSSRGDRVHRDAFWPAVGGKAAREAFDGGFGACVQSMVTHAGHVGRDGGRENDSAPAGAMSEAVLRDEELAAGVEVENVVIILLRHVFLLFEGLHAGVRHDNVESAIVREGPLEEGADFGGLGNVGLDGNCPRAEGEEFRYDVLGGPR